MQSKTGIPSSHQLKSFVAQVPPEIRGTLSCQQMLAFLFFYITLIVRAPYFINLNNNNTFQLKMLLFFVYLHLTAREQKKASIIIKFTVLLSCLINRLTPYFF